MKPIKLTPALIAGGMTTVVTGIVMQLVRNSGASLPQHSWWEVLLLAVVAGALLAAGWRMRQYVQGLKQVSRERQDAMASGMDAEEARAAAGPLPVAAPESDFARRTLVCAQAAAVGGLVLTGWYLGQFGVLVDRWQAQSGRAALILLGVLALAGTALSFCGFRVQKWCTLPEDQR